MRVIGTNRAENWHIVIVAAAEDEWPRYSISVLKGEGRAGREVVVGVRVVMQILKGAGWEQVEMIPVALIPFILGALGKEPTAPTRSVFDGALAASLGEVEVSFRAGVNYPRDEMNREYQAFRGTVVMVAGPDVTGPTRATIRIEQGLLRGRAVDVDHFRDLSAGDIATMWAYRDGRVFIMRGEQST